MDMNEIIVDMTARFSKSGLVVLLTDNYEKLITHTVKTGQTLDEFLANAKNEYFKTVLEIDPEAVECSGSVDTTGIVPYISSVEGNKLSDSDKLFNIVLRLVPEHWIFTYVDEYKIKKIEVILKKDQSKRFSCRPIAELKSLGVIITDNSYSHNSVFTRSAALDSGSSLIASDTVENYIECMKAVFKEKLEK